MLKLCLAVTFMSLASMTSIEVAGPSIQRELHTSPAVTGWMISAYSAGLSAVLIPAGRIGDGLSRRHVFLSGLILFVVANGMGGFAGNAAWLIVIRVGQGMAAAVLHPQMMGLIEQSGPTPYHRRRAIALIGMSVGIATALGPLYGGVVIDITGSWRWMFLPQCLLGVASLSAAMRVLPRDRPHSSRPLRINIAGLLLLAAAIGGLVLGLVSDNHRWLAAAAGMMAVFVLSEHHTGTRSRPSAPLMDLRLLTSFRRMCAVVIGAFHSGWAGLFLLLPLYFHNLGYTAAQSGLVVAVVDVGFAVSSAASQRVPAARTARFAGSAASVAGLAAVAVLMGMDPVPAWVAALIMAGVLLLVGGGGGLVSSPNRDLMLSEVSVARSGSAAALLQTAEQLGAAAGLAVASAMFEARISHGSVHAAVAGVDAVVCFPAAAFVVAALELLIQHHTRPAGPSIEG